MARYPRVQFEGAQYHIYPRGNHRERIAHTDRDYRILECYFIEAARKMGVRPRAWYPMPNHFHAFLETPFGNISAFMQCWLSRYARYYNRTYGKIGHLFQGRFGSRLVQNDIYQKELIRYIHLQRHRSKDPSKVDAFCDRYSSHRFYMGESYGSDVAAWIEPMLGLFGESIDSARRNYALFMADGLKSGKWQDFYKPLNGIIGDEHFAKTMESRQQERNSEIHIPTSRRKQFMKDILEQATTQFTVSTAQLSSSSQRRDWSRIRQAVAYCGWRMGLSVTELAHALRRGHPAICAMIRATENRPSEEVRSLQARLNL